MIKVIAQPTEIRTLRKIQSLLSLETVTTGKETDIAQRDKL